MIKYHRSKIVAILCFLAACTPQSNEYALVKAGNLYYDTPVASFENKCPDFFQDYNPKYLISRQGIEIKLDSIITYEGKCGYYLEYSGIRRKDCIPDYFFSGSIIKEFDTVFVVPNGCHQKYPLFVMNHVNTSNWQFIYYTHCFNKISNPITIAGEGMRHSKRYLGEKHQLNGEIYRIRISGIYPYIESTDVVFLVNNEYGIIGKFLSIPSKNNSDEIIYNIQGDLVEDEFSYKNITIAY